MEYQRSLPPAVQFVAMDTYGGELFIIQNDRDGMLHDLYKECACKLDVPGELLRHLKE